MAYGTLSGHCERLAPLQPFFGYYTHDLGNHIPCPPDDDRIANPYVLALYFISVMQCRIRYCYAAHPHGTEPRHRRQSTGTADLHLDIQHFCHSLFRRELAGDGPPGSPGDKAEFSLVFQVIDLEDNTVYFIGQL